MRLRSSQFVMLLLLACSVQLGEACAFRLIAAQTLQAASSSDVLATAPSRADGERSRPDRSSIALNLSQSAAAAERTPWSMPHPASATASLASFTSLLRA